MNSRPTPVDCPYLKGSVQLEIAECSRRYGACCRWIGPAATAWRLRVGTLDQARHRHAPPPAPTAVRYRRRRDVRRWGSSSRRVNAGAASAPTKTKTKGKDGGWQKRLHHFAARSRPRVEAGAAAAAAARMGVEAGYRGCRRRCRP